MEDRWSFRKNLTKLSLILFTAAFVLSMASMLTYAAGKAVIIENSEADPGETVASESDNKAQVYSHTLELKSVTRADATGDVIIRCPAMPSGENISVEQRYDKNSVILTWNGGHGDYFLDYTPEGKMSHVKKLVIADDGDKVSFSVSLDTMCECEISYNNREAVLNFLPVSESDIVVAIDASHGGSYQGIMVGNLKEKEILLATADRIKRLSKDKPYRVILLRTGDYALSDEERVKLLTAVGADYYVGLHTSVDSSDERIYGMYAEYNGNYWRNGLSNVKFADCILKNACEVASNRGISLTDAYDAPILKDLTIPAANLYIGYMSNKDEAALLVNGTYVSKIAEGILKGIDEALKE